MIELKFTVDEELDRRDLIKILHHRDYIYAIEEIKELLRNILVRENIDNESIPENQYWYDLVEKIRAKVHEICAALPEE